MMAAWNDSTRQRQPAAAPHHSASQEPRERNTRGHNGSQQGRE